VVGRPGLTTMNSPQPATEAKLAWTCSRAHRMGWARARLMSVLWVACASMAATFAETSNSTGPGLSQTAASESVVSSLVRVLGAMALVIAVFLGGLWLVRSWQRMTIQRGCAPKLSVLEVKSLGQRHALYVVGYEDQRLLLSASPSGVSMLTHLPPSTDTVSQQSPAEPAKLANDFAAALMHLMKRRP